LETSKHLVPKIFRFDPEMVQPCDVEPPATQSSISTAAPSVLDATLRHFAALAVGWMNVAVEVGPEGPVVVVVVVVEVGPEGPVVVVVERGGVPVSHAMDPPQASPGSGVPSHVQVACRA
jgi:uncharacterized protein (DUF1501 family)